MTYEGMMFNMRAHCTWYLLDPAFLRSDTMDSPITRPSPHPRHLMLEPVCRSSSSNTLGMPYHQVPFDKNPMLIGDQVNDRGMQYVGSDRDRDLRVLVDNQCVLAISELTTGEPAGCKNSDREETAGNG